MGVGMGVVRMLTIRKVETAKPKGKEYKLADQRGLYLFVTPCGGKLWRYKYRVGRIEKLMALGKYPDILLADARERHQQARTMLAKGSDPMAERNREKQAQRERVEHSFRAVAHRWHTHWKQGRTERHAKYVWSRLERDILPRLGERPIAEIDSSEIVRTLRAISDRGVADLAKRAMQVTSAVFRYANAHRVPGVMHNPCGDFRPGDVLPSTKKTNYARVSAKELPKLLQTIAAYPSQPTRLAMQFLAVTFVRTSELIGAKWQEIDFEGGRWDIPAERMKMKTPHIVPLSSQAIEILTELRGLSAGSPYIFPGLNPQKPMSNNTILKALERMGYKGRMTGHGFRGLASTLLHEQGLEHEHIELQLAHQKRDQTSAAYNHALHLQARAAMMRHWANYLDEQRQKGQTLTEVRATA